MHVIKRDGQREPVMLDKISERVGRLCGGLDAAFVDPAAIACRVAQGVRDGVSTAELDELATETAAYMAMQHPDYSRLAARIAVSGLHKKTPGTFREAVAALRAHRTSAGAAAPMVSAEIAALAEAHAGRLEAAIDYDRDYELDYFGFKTLERGYLMRAGPRIVERPQHMLMRVALGIHGSDVDAALETYDLMSRRFFVHATPTMFNAGAPAAQMSSCFLLTVQSDSIEGIFGTLGQCAQISKSAGGIGVAVSDVRATGSYIRGSGGSSNGLVPMLRVFDATAKYVDQGGGKRRGAFAVYLEPWHADVFDVLLLKKNSGAEDRRARDLFYAMWIPDLFMRRVEAGGQWSLFCPSSAPGLADLHSAEFDARYEEYEAQGRALRAVPARELWFAMLSSQTETGTPYLLYKDACNAKSNQSNLGTIRCSNLCTEVVQFSSPDEAAVCNLASVALPRFVADGAFDHARLAEVVRVVARNLDRVIDRTAYPLPEARRSNTRHRPVGIGVQGLADVFLLLRLPFDAPEARALNRDIFETIYHAALSASCEMAEQRGAYETYAGSPVSRGVLQFDMWGVRPSDRWDWAALRVRIAKHGVRNSLLVAPMPTASTSQILGFNECVEPYTSNLYSRRVLAGEFAVVNRHLVRDLVARGLWDEATRTQIMAHNGSVQAADRVPDDLKPLYRTAWELPMRSVIDMAADRGAFICQSQSLNLFVSEPTLGKLSSMHFHAWRRGLKSTYYLRTRAAVDAIKFTIDPATVKLAASDQKAAADKKAQEDAATCGRDDGECLSCGA